MYARWPVVSSALLPLELQSAWRRRYAEARLDAGEYRRLLALLTRHRGNWTLLAVNAAVLLRSEGIVGDLGVRSLDAIHLASALLFMEGQHHRLRFFTADHRQAQAATALDLRLEWLG